MVSERPRRMAVLGPQAFGPGATIKAAAEAGRSRCGGHRGAARFRREFSHSTQLEVVGPDYEVVDPGFYVV